MSLFTIFAAGCHTDFFGFPTWYKYLNHPNCTPEIHSLSDVWLIVAAIIEIALRIAAIAAVLFIIYGGFSYTTSQGDPEGTKTARNTIVNALIGLALAVMAAAIVSFIARSIQ